MIRYLDKKWWQRLLAICLCTCILGQLAIYPVWANDRSADIIGSRPLLVKNWLNAAGLTGKGQIVGIADSGLDRGSMSDIHPDLQSAAGSLPKVFFLKSYTDRVLADDPNGHGTFMAATIAGSGQASQGQYKGIAPGASLYFQALLDKNNNLQVPDNLEDLFMPAYSAGVRIHVDGWGGGSNIYSSNSAAIDSFVFHNADFLPVFGAGNSGPGSGTLTTQANSKNALVIGSSQVPRPAFDPQARYADQSAESSSQGPTGDGRIKPDLVAPGSALISARSSLVTGNFAANSFYTRMGGTSMAAAVAGGALALLREQLQTQLGVPAPSSALLKALLINGARTGAGSRAEQGFGILDSAGTALALQEGTFKFNDEKNRLQEGQFQEYKLQVTDTSMPVKVTLTWVDPPGTPGTNALVNNLDLVVQDPNGKTYYGNDFEAKGQVDRVNNVEQVSIPLPKTGEYTVRVRAGQMGRIGGQNYALVYGQTLPTGIVQAVNGEELILQDGSRINLETAALHNMVDGVLRNTSIRVQVGSNVYRSPATIYTFGQTWQTGGIQALPTAAGELLLEINRTVREGGYYLDPQVVSTPGIITVNGQPVSSISAIPSGSEIKAWVNPALQTLWKLAASNEEVVGVIREVNPISREVTLLDPARTYPLAPWVALSYRDQIVDSSLQDTPYGTAEDQGLEKIMPGTKVIMQVSPQSGVVQSLLLERTMAIGKVAAIDLENRRIELDTDRSYQLLAATLIYRDKIEVSLDTLKIGDGVQVLLRNDGKVAELQAHSQVSYGRVVYASSRLQNLVMIDSDNRARNFIFNPETEVFGWGIPLESNAVDSGSWVRVISDPTGQTAERVDLAEVGEAKAKTLAGFDSRSNILKMTDGSEYICSSFTRISKGGYSIAAEDMTIGEKAVVTTLLAPAPWYQVVAAVEVKTRSDIEEPRLKMTVYQLNGALIVQGNTSANRLYLYRQDGSRERIIVSDSRFSALFRSLENETGLRVVALDTRSGGMKVSDMDIVSFPSNTTAVSFNDIAGHWAESSISTLASRNILKGYSDGSFHPDQILSRAELVAIVARLQNLSATETNLPVDFIDQQDIPWWAMEAVLAARQTGLISGYPDGSFQPTRSITRGELEMIVARIKKQSAVNLFPGEVLQPNLPVTRAQAAAILAQL